jgi:hypothetical protein
MAKRTEEELRFLVQQFNSNSTKEANPIVGLEEQMHSPETMVKQAIRSSWANRKRVHFGPRPAKVVSIRNLPGRPSDYGYFSNKRVIDTASPQFGWKSLLCYVADHDASVPDTIIESPEGGDDGLVQTKISNTLKMKLLEKFYISPTSDVGQVAVGSIVLVDYHDRALRKDGFIVELLKEPNNATYTVGTTSETTQSLFQSTDAGFTGPPVEPDTPHPDHPPGEQSKLLEDLEPNFRARLEAVMAATKEQGYEFRVVATYRDQERQQYEFDKGNSETLRGLHNNVDENDQPAALAADLRPPQSLYPLAEEPQSMTEEEAAWWWVLREESNKQSLWTGASFPLRRTSEMPDGTTPGALWGIGWDPGHVEIFPKRAVRLPGDDEPQQVAESHD